MTTDLTDVEAAQSVILRELRDAEAPVPLVFFDDILDRRLFTVALNRLARTGVVDISNGHIAPSRSRLVGAPALTPEQTPPAVEPATVTVPVALLERLTAALEKAERTQPPSPVPVPGPPILIPEPPPALAKPMLVPNHSRKAETPTPESVARRACVSLHTYGPMPRQRLRSNYLPGQGQREVLSAALAYAVKAGAIRIGVAPRTLHLADPTKIGISWAELDAARDRLRWMAKMKRERAQAAGKPVPNPFHAVPQTAPCRPQPRPPVDEVAAIDQALEHIVEYLADHPGHHSSWLTYHALPSSLKGYATAALKLGLARGVIVTGGPDRKGVPYRLAPKPGVAPEPESRPAVGLPMPAPIRRSPVTAGGRSHGKTMERVAAAVLDALSQADADEMTEAQIARELDKRDRPWVPRVMLLLLNRGEVARTGKGFCKSTSTNKSDGNERIER